MNICIETNNTAEWGEISQKVTKYSALKRISWPECFNRKPDASKNSHSKGAGTNQSAGRCGMNIDDLLAKRESNKVKSIDPGKTENTGAIIHQ